MMVGIPMLTVFCSFLVGFVSFGEAVSYQIYTEITEIMILMTDACNIQKSVHNLVEL